ncbi:MAG: hypothetical protein ACLTYN_15165 [Dysosmobacter welbionis]
MDLTQAEAVVDLIDAETAAAARNAAAQLDGGLRRVLEPVQEELLEVTSRFYAVVDYPDEDIQDVRPEGSPLPSGPPLGGWSGCWTPAAGDRY